MHKNILIKNARIVTPHEIIENGQLYVEDGIIKKTGTAVYKTPDTIIDARGSYLFPGFIDLHNDGMEKELQPRPNTMFPLEQSFISLENRLISHGITTIFHSFSLTQSTREVRDIRFIQPMINTLNNLSCYASIRHFVHMRYEITEPVFAEYIIELIKNEKIHMVSFMDHTPGQGQYKNHDYLVEFMRQQYQWSDDEIQEIIDYKIQKSEDPSLHTYIDRIIETAKKYNIPLASHDDDSIEKVRSQKHRGISIAEFPITLETAEEAVRLGMHSMVGAPNIIMDKSTSGNMKATEAIAKNAADIICSDYYSPGMLHSVFSLAERGLCTLPEAVNMASRNPAFAVGIENKTGSLEEGKEADMLIIGMNGPTPFVSHAFISGIKVYEKMPVIFDSRIWLDAAKHTKAACMHS